MHDVDLVALPKDIKGLKARCTRACEVLADGLQNYRIKTASGVQLEIYFAQPESPDLFKPTPSTWGTLLLCRKIFKGFRIRKVVTGYSANNGRVAGSSRSQARPELLIHNL